MKIKLITPDKPIFQVWGYDGVDDICLVIQADSKEQAKQIARQYHLENHDMAVTVYNMVQIDLIAEDIE